jgi:hypothetical protein
MYDDRVFNHNPARGGFERNGISYFCYRLWFEQRVGNRHPGRWNCTVHLFVGALRRNRSNGYRFGGGYLHGNHHRCQRMYHYCFSNGNPTRGFGGNGFFANKRFLQRRQQRRCNG